MGFVVGWGGLVVLLAAVLAAVLADVFRQSRGRRNASTSGTPLTRACTAVAVVLSVAGVVATAIRFSSTG